jgi:hypothetical protein
MEVGRRYWQRLFCSADNSLVGANPAPAAYSLQAMSRADILVRWSEPLPLDFMNKCSPPYAGGAAIPDERQFIQTTWPSRDRRSVTLVITYEAHTASLNRPARSVSGGKSPYNLLPLLLTS